MNLLPLSAKIIALISLALLVAPVNGQQSQPPLAMQVDSVPNVYQVYFGGLTKSGNPLGAVVKEGSTGRVAHISKDHPEDDVLVEFSIVSDPEKSKATGRDLVEISSSVSTKRDGQWVIVASPSVYTDLNSNRPATLQIPGGLALTIDAKLIETSSIPAACAKLTGKDEREFSLDRILSKLVATSSGPTSPVNSATLVAQGPVPACCCCNAYCNNGSGDS